MTGNRRWHYTLIMKGGDSPSFAKKTGNNNPFKDINAGAMALYFVPTFVNTDDDDDLELVVGNNFARAKLYDKGSEGFYAEKTGEHNPFHDIGEIRHPFFSDINGDGKLDLIFTRYHRVNGFNVSYILYFQKDASGDGYTQKTGENNPFRDFSNVYALDFIDLNGDGAL